MTTTSGTGHFTIAQQVGIEKGSRDELPLSFEVDDLFPNPTRSSAELRYQLPEAQKVSIEVYDILGRRVLSVFDGFQSAGTYDKSRSVILDGLAAGSYLIRIQSEMGSAVKSLTLVR